MNLKSLVTLLIFFLTQTTCTSTAEREKRPMHHLNVSPKKYHLLSIDSLIKNGEHRKALVMLDSFQAKEEDLNYLIESENLLEKALDSLYSE